MSTQSQSTTKFQTDSETGIILASSAHADEVEARKDELLDAKAIDKAQQSLADLEDRMNQLSSMSDMFDDNEDGPISTGPIERPEPTPVPAAAAPEMDDIPFEEDEGLGVEEDFVIGGLEDAADEEDLLSGVFPDDGLMAPFDDGDISGAVDEAPLMAEDLDDVTDFQMAADEDLDHNRTASEEVQATAAAMAESEVAVGEAALDDPEPAPEPAELQIEDYEFDILNKQQSLASLVRPSSAPGAGPCPG